MIACPGCAAVTDWASDACPQCGFAPPKVDGFAAWAPEMAHLGGGFEAGYFAGLAPQEAGSFWFRNRNDVLIWALRRYFPVMASFVEVGCGTGFVLSGIAASFPHTRLVGTEIFTDGLAFAAVRLPGATLLQVDARRIPFVDEFDVAGAFDVIEHIDEDVDVLRNLQAAVKPGGGVVITVPQHAWLWSPADDYGHHVRRYTAADLHAKIESVGLKIVYSTSFVTLLLPLMLASRLLARRAGEDFDPMKEFRIGGLASAALGGVMSLERAALRLGLRPPFGGSRLVVARKAAGDR